MVITVQQALNMGLTPTTRPNSRGYLLRADYPRQNYTIVEAARLIGVDATTLRAAIHSLNDCKPPKTGQTRKPSRCK